MLISIGLSLNNKALYKITIKGGQYPTHLFIYFNFFDEIQTFCCFCTFQENI